MASPASSAHFLLTHYHIIKLNFEFERHDCSVFIKSSSYPYFHAQPPSTYFVISNFTCNINILMYLKSWDL